MGYLLVSFSGVVPFDVIDSRILPFFTKISAELIRRHQPKNLLYSFQQRSQGGSVCILAHIAMDTAILVCMYSFFIIKTL